MAAPGGLEAADGATGPDVGASATGTTGAPGSFDQPRPALVGILAAVALPLLAATLNHARQPWLPTADDALIVIRALDVPGHLPLLGAYSRYGFDHPGPLLFYVLAAPAHLFGPIGVALMTGVLSTTAATACCYVAWRRGGVVLTIATAVVVLLFAHAMGPALVSPWNPWVAVLPYLLSVLLAWGVSQRDWRLLPWLVLSASFSAQAHLSYAPFAGVLVLGALGWALVAGRRSDGSRSAARPSAAILGVTFGLLLLLWLPPLVQQVRADDGNLTRLARHFLTDHSAEQTAGPFTDMKLPERREVLGIVARELGSLPPWIGASEGVEPFSSNVTGANLLLLPAPFIASAIAFVLAWRRRYRDVIALQAIVLGLVVLSAVTLSRVTGGLTPYIVRPTWVPACLMTLSTVWAFCRVAGAGAPASGTTRSTRLGTSRTTAAGVAVVAVIATIVGVALVRMPRPDAGLSDMLTHVIDPTAAHLPVGKEVRVHAVGEGGLEMAGGVEAELIRRGVAVVVDPDLVNRYGPHRVGSDPHPASVTVVMGTDRRGFVPSPTQLLVTTYDPLTPSEQAEHDELADREVQNFAALAKGEPPPFLASPTATRRLDALRSRGAGLSVYVDQGS
jgi:hypothetical protein